jgi:hypothetical protein
MRQCPPPLVQNYFWGIFFVVIFQTSPLRSNAQIVAYEGDVLPEIDAAPWTRLGTLDALRWSDNGLFCQLISPGQNDIYRRTIPEFTSSPSFFVTWREMTDIPRSYISSTPSGISVPSSETAVLFTFTVTSDQVQFIRDNPIGLVMYVDVEPGVLHTYFLALHADLSYDWYIDGLVVNSGQYPSPYPDASARIQWWARSFTTMPEQTAKWDYVRYGVIPPDHSGDFNNNGAVDETDLYFFVDCLLGPDYDAAAPGCKWADMDSNGKADGADVQLFATAMTGA